MIALVAGVALWGTGCPSNDGDYLDNINTNSQGPQTPGINPPSNPSQSTIETIILYASDDADVSSLNPQENYGHERSLRTGVVNFGSAGDDYYTAFVNFDTRGLFGREIIEADLIVTTAFNNSAMKPVGTLSLSYVTDHKWNEDTITWVNSPSSGTYIVSKEIGFDVTKTHEFDVTGAVKKWVSDSSSNKGFMLGARSFTNVRSAYAPIYSKESSRDSGPRLRVKYRD